MRKAPTPSTVNGAFQDHHQRDDFTPTAQHLSEEAIGQATSVKIEATRKLGEILLETPKATGAKGVGPIAVPKEYRNIAINAAFCSVRDKAKAHHVPLEKLSVYEGSPTYWDSMHEMDLMDAAKAVQS